MGWLLALPIAGGVLLGRILDSRFETGYAWTLTLLGAGIGVACLEGVLTVRATLRRDGDD